MQNEIDIGARFKDAIGTVWVVTEIRPPYNVTLENAKGSRAIISVRELSKLFKEARNGHTRKI